MLEALTAPSIPPPFQRVCGLTQGSRGAWDAPSLRLPDPAKEPKECMVQVQVIHVDAEGVTVAVPSQFFLDYRFLDYSSFNIAWGGSWMGLGNTDN